ncbi:alpha/beta fold hydrolase [Microbacterium sp. JZ37]|uniref:alpha/beta fold hydrolase n=1 Tax=Microbacterium sp. JZ37 TaxID=2654193 RepID=UPI002B4938F9|nr:alpha/beta fold hydrolase [Microbacterium sp. JZ37]WRH18861.1 alpha/beta fold hydrolase [Microbacterium sp. JZ37]
MSAFPVIHPAHAETGTRPLVLLHGGNVANWMWAPQVEAFRDRLVLTPDLPGFGARTAEDWPGLDAVADDVVAQVRSAGVGGAFDLVGLSLGGVVALRLLARHGADVPRALVTGAPLTGVGRSARAITALQLALWDAAWFWRAQAAAFRLPEDAREEFVRHGLSVRKENARAMSADVDAGRVPTGLGAYGGALLAVAGEREPAVVRRSLAVLRAALPTARTGLVPRMHHVWNVEDVPLFNDVVREWMDGRMDPRIARAD